MARLTIIIACDNAAFDGDDRSSEIARVLREAAKEIEAGSDFGTCRDANGNRVGSYDFEL